MQKVAFKNTNGLDVTMSAVLYFPDPFDKAEKYPTIVLTHPGGGVKEQTSGLYAKRLAAQGFVTIAFDASYQGESTGKLRQLENPYIRTEDISAVIDFLITLPYVDENLIGAVGICAGGGYSANAAINDHRIKALGTVSAVNIGQMFRNGWGNTIKDEDALPTLQFGGQARSQDVRKSEMLTIPLAPQTKVDAQGEEMEQAWEYYRTPRCANPNAPSFTLTRNLTQLLTYDAYQFAESFLTQPLLCIAGSVAGSKWMSEGLVERAASKDKQLLEIEGANHMMLYDVEPYVSEVVEKLGAFFKRTLC